MKLHLRGHHLLCLKGFQGYGYDEDFTQNMIEVNRQRKCENTTVAVSDSLDDICRACPNLKDGICMDEHHNERIIRMDNEVLKKIDGEKEYSSVELFEKIGMIFNTEESVSEICSNCMWHDKCLFYQKLSNNR